MPTTKPIYTYLALLCTLAVAFGCFRLWLRNVTPMQRFYLPLYVKTGLVPSLSGKMHPYGLWLDPAGYLATSLTPDTRYVIKRATPTRVHDSLARDIYGGGLDQSARWYYELLGAFAVLAVGFGARADGNRRRRLRDGVQIRGRRVISPRRFNRRAMFRDSFEIQIEDHANTTTPL